MLLKLLRQIAGSHGDSLVNLAKKLETDPEMVREMVLTLNRLGYIILDEPACRQEECDKCGACCSYKIGMNTEGSGMDVIRWELTEKGITAAGIGST